MKGLLLKDWYMMKKYCWPYLLITAVFLAVSCVSKVSSSIFFSFYPCILCGMIPVNLLSYDERSGWMQYSGALPYTKKQIVSSKYLVGLFSILAVMAVTLTVQVIQMNVTDRGFVIADYLVSLFLMWLLSAACLSLCMPFVFRFGTENGKIVYSFLIGIFFVGIAIPSLPVTWIPESKFASYLLVIGFALLGIGIYALPWYLSVVFYRKREL